MPRSPVGARAPHPTEEPIRHVTIHGPCQRAPHPLSHASWLFGVPRHLNAVLFVTLVVGWACASDKPTGPPAAAEIKIMDTAFVPAIVSIDPGQTIEWINRSRDHRTVTSGFGAADPEAGQDFDVDLAGYRPGEPDGGTSERHSRTPTRFTSSAGSRLRPRQHHQRNHHHPLGLDDSISASRRRSAYRGAGLPPRAPGLVRRHAVFSSSPSSW
jgi:plastocyanin